MIRFTILFVAALMTGGGAKAACRQALALGLDVSGSVSVSDYSLQMGGLAAALEAPQVVSAFLAVPGTPVALSIYEWSGDSDQKLLLDWTPIGEARDLRRIASALRATPRRRAQSGTAIGDAMGFGLALIADGPECWRRTLDISGDGRSNTGRALSQMRDLAAAQDVTVNGLVIAADAPLTSTPSLTELERLRRYFEGEVIVGEDAFVESATGFDDFARAMERKLLREIFVPVNALLED